MASVYAAVDERLGRSVAIKILSDSLCSDESFVRRFQHEAEAAARLSHPNIVSVYDVGADQGRRFIVMELIAGRNLKDLIRDRGPLSMEQLVAIGAEILDGLGYAHQHGLIHRDIKPQNILISREGTPKLADFGIAKAVEASSTTQTAMVLGSVHYLAPEVAAGEPASIQSDLYSMGVVLYEMATGGVPFEGTNLLAIASRHIHDQPQAPSRSNPQIPVELNGLILKALAKAPDRRYESAEEMARDVRAVPIKRDPVALASLDATAAVGPVEPTPSPRTWLSLRPTCVRYILWAFVIAVVAVLINRAGGLLPNGPSHDLGGQGLTAASVVVGALALLTLLAGIVERFRHRYAVDEFAVTVESGIFGHHRDAIPVRAIVNLQLHQSPPSRLLDIGTIVLSTGQLPGQGPIALELRDVAHASEVYDAILSALGAGNRRVAPSDGVVHDLGA